MSLSHTDQGAMLVVDLICSGDRAQITIPVATTVPWPSRVEAMKKLVEAAESVLLPLLLDCLVDEASVIGFEAQSMSYGDVPWRKNYDEGVNPGTNAGMPLPMSCGAKLDFYFDPSDVSPGNKTKVVHNTLPGLPEGDVDGKTINAIVVAALQAFADKLVSGFADSGGDYEWKRVHHFLKSATDEALRVAVIAVAKAVVGSVRRRLLP